MGRPRTRKPKPGETQQMSIALDGAVVQKMDRALDRLNNGRGPSWTRSDIVREAILEWLDSKSNGTT